MDQLFDSEFDLELYSLCEYLEPFLDGETQNLIKVCEEMEENTSGTR